MGMADCVGMVSGDLLLWKQLVSVGMALLCFDCMVSVFVLFVEDDRLC